jgi:hypothetical protein
MPTEIVGTSITGWSASFMTPAEIIIAKLAENYRFRQKRGLADMDYTILAVDR